MREPRIPQAPSREVEADLMRCRNLQAGVGISNSVAPSVKILIPVRNLLPWTRQIAVVAVHIIDMPAMLAVRVRTDARAGLQTIRSGFRD